MVFSWFYKSKCSSKSHELILYPRTYQIQNDWEIIRSPNDIEGEVHTIDTNGHDFYMDRSEYGTMDMAESSFEISETRTSSSITSMSDDCKVNQPIEGEMQEECNQSETKAVCKNIDQIIDDLLIPRDSARNAFKTNVTKSRKKRRNFSHKARKARKFSNRRQARKTK
eukprot:178862_1